MTRTVLTRLILLACGVLAIAAAATAMRVNHWSPIDAFLEHRTTTPVLGTTIAGDLQPGGAAAANHSPFGAYSPDAVPPAAGFATGTAGRLDLGKPSASGWSTDRLQGAGAAGAAGPSASLGGLWQLMGLAKHPGATHPIVSTPHTTTRTAATPKPPRTPSHHSSNGGTPAHATAPVAGAATPVGTIAMVTAPAILIGNNAPPVSTLIGGTTGGGTLGTPGGTKLAGGGTGGGLSATPEPTSALLFGTGLLGLALMLRRKRA